MLKSLFIYLRFLSFWLLFFLIDRIIFLLYFPEKVKSDSLAEILGVFWHGLRLDLSTACYIIAIPLLVFIFFLFAERLKLSPKVPKYFTRFLIVLFSFITIVNFNIYRDWGSKINFRALQFAFNSPSEAMASSESSPIYSSFSIFFILVAVAFFLENKIIRYKMPKGIALSKKIGLAFSGIVLTFLLIRGGWQLTPINESMAYYSETPFLNHAAINTEWALIHDVLNNKYSKENPFRFFSKGQALDIARSLYTSQSSASTPEILTTKRPNVVVIVLESYTADVIESLGGEKGIAPNFEKLIAGGLFFDHVYAAGNRTDKGLVAVLSGFPAQGKRSVMNENNKQEKLPALAQLFDATGYKTSFYYGGESEFFNMKSYFMTHKYHRIVDKHQFSSKDMNSKWGAYDDVVYQKQIEDLKSEPQPFFSTLLTLTNHEPFELPVRSKFPGDDEPSKFKSTAYYADSCLYAYLQVAKKQKWYDNTLFVIVADHGHRLPLNKYEIFEPQRYRIPLLFFGNAIKPEYRGKKISKIMAQTDIAATLFTQLGIDHSRFLWSKDILKPDGKQFAFFNWDQGFGFALPGQTVSYDNIGKNIVYKDPKTLSGEPEALKYGKACMQEVYQEYQNF